MVSTNWLEAFNYRVGQLYDISYRGRASSRYLYSGFIDGRHVFTRTIPGTNIRDTYRFSVESEGILITEACDIIVG